MAVAGTFDVAGARAHFPALKQDQVFMDNAGGSQILGECVASIGQYLNTNNVQLGATYRVGQASTDAYAAGFKAAAKYINAAEDEIVIGASTTQLFRNLSSALRPHFEPGSEIVISGIDHEANIASWLTLADDLGIIIKWWQPQSPSSHNPQLTPDSLEPLLTPKTRMVTCTHTSNILGSITPVKPIADLVHSKCPGALLCVDAVAYAPHRPIDVKALGVDIYAFSWYKVYGPHIAQLYVRRGVQDLSMRSLGHYFKPGSTLEDKLGLGAASYELVQCVPEICSYLAQPSFWEGAIMHEEVLQEILLSYLRSKPEVFTICGVPQKAKEMRVPVISWVVKGKSSKAFVENVEKRTNFAFRWGHFYSKRLVNDVLGLADEGVIRVSLCHYNTIEELQNLVAELEKEISTGST